MAAAEAELPPPPPEAASQKLVIKSEPQWDPGPAPELLPQLQEPPVPLLAPVCGLQPLLWSQDHRLAVCTSSALSVVELRCDLLSPRTQLSLHRSAIRLSRGEHRLQVASLKQQEAAHEKFSSHPDPAVKQAYLADSVMNLKLPLPSGVKYVSWSPLGCDSRGRCLLALLTLDHRLCVYQSLDNHDWDLQADLSQAYGERLRQRGYANKDQTDKSDILNFEELQRRFSMQTPVRMEWSSVYTTRQVLPSNICEDVEVVLLAVLMENGDLVLWKFTLPFVKAESVEFYDVIESGVERPSDLAWWEYESGGRRMSGLIVGSQVGPVKIMPVSLTGIRGYFTLRHPVVLWKEQDQIAVKNLKCVAMVHPALQVGCSLIVASRGCYVFWCLLMISSTGLSIHNSHVAGLHSLPIASLAVSQRPVAVHTCSSDGSVKRLTPTFTEKSLFFKPEDVAWPEALAGRRTHGLAVSQNGAYLAVVGTQGLTDGFHPTVRTYQVHLMALKSPKAAGEVLVSSNAQSLYKMSDLLDIVRLQVLKDRQIPAGLQQDLDTRIQAENSVYLWKLKLFLVRTLCRALQRPEEGARWRGMAKVPRSNEGTAAGDEETEAGEEETAAGDRGAPADWRRTVEKEEDTEEQVSEVQAWINSVETHLMRENIKKVLGAVYLNPLITQRTSIPTCGLLHFLSTEGGEGGDRDAEVLMGHVRTKLNKQSFQELCSLCEEVLPFSDCRQATCANGHVWLRCGLSFQACQALTFRRCLLQDTICRLPEPEEPLWIQKLLQAPCALCDSPMM